MDRTAASQDRAKYDRFVREALVLGEAIAGRAGAIEDCVDGSAQALEQPRYPTRVEFGS